MVKLTSAVASATIQAFSAFVSSSARFATVYLTAAATVDGRHVGFLVFACESGENRQICSLRDGPLRGPFFVPWAKWSTKSKLRTCRRRQSAY
jgi:hypothetical protein